MKKLFFILLIVISASQLYSQNRPKNAIGIRLSEGFIGDEGFGPEITYQRQIISEHNRFDANLSYKSNSFISTYRSGVFFHWTYNIWDNLNWFAGPGVGFGVVDFKTRYFGITVAEVDRDSEFFPFIGGDFGVDYQFDFPLQVAFSIRPTFDFHDIDRYNGYGDVDNVGASVGISARYTF
ncbi:hypothetical protein [Aquimarina aquimarini]|uniref:hypothetical protein n=1 Tax=Aquimarina aquimarini TaxID=1191734 RepID=UPI000D5517D3|nr:hypothetical protein [Aquimarina aquimarini]